jgi:hypothetical protein
VDSTGNVSERCSFRVTVRAVEIPSQSERPQTAAGGGGKSVSAGVKAIVISVAIVALIVIIIILTVCIWRKTHPPDESLLDDDNIMASQDQPMGVEISTFYMPSQRREYAGY